MIGNTPDSYGIVAKLLHWIVAIAIIALILVGYYMSDLPNSDGKYQLYSMHKASGVCVLIFIVIRLIWRIMNITPSMPKDTPHWQVIAADVNIKFLYFLMLCQPLSGIFMSLYSGYPINVFNLFTIQAFEKKIKLASLAKEFHEAFSVLLIICVSLHLLAALYHHFIRKDGLLRRMF